MELMSAAVYVGDGEIEVRDARRSGAGPGEVLVEVRTAGSAAPTCTSCSSATRGPGSVLGHEWAGTIAARRRRRRGWEIGTRGRAGPDARVRRVPGVPRGGPSVCLRREPADLLDFRGAFCRYKVVPARLLASPTPVDRARPRSTEPTAIAIHTVNLAGVTPDDRVLVTGGGPVGLLTTAVLRAQRHRRHHRRPSRRRRARARAGRRRGACDRARRAAAARRWAGPVAEPYTVAFECSGNAARGGVGARPARLRGHARVRRHRARDAAHQPQPGDRPRAHDHRRVQLRRRRLRARARAARVGRRCRSTADRARRRVARRACSATMHRLAAGELPGKVMVRPEVGRVMS